MFYIVYSSVTYANRIKRFFENERGFVGIAHTPSAISSGGCSYCLRLDENKARRAVELSRKCGIKVLGMFKEGEDKMFTKVEIV